MQRRILWSAPEHEHHERSSDWFWSVGVVAVGGAVLAILFNDLLFSAVIIVGAVALVLHVLRKPREIHCEITDRGVTVDTTLYPFVSLDSFWIHEHTLPNKLVLTSQKFFMPHVIVPLSGVSAEEVRNALLDDLPELEVRPSFSEHIMERLGF